MYINNAKLIINYPVGFVHWIGTIFTHHMNCYHLINCSPSMCAIYNLLFSEICAPEYHLHMTTSTILPRASVHFCAWTQPQF